MTMTEAQRAYEAKRAARAGLSLEQWLATKGSGQQSVKPGVLENRTAASRVITLEQLKQAVPGDVFTSGLLYFRFKAVTDVQISPAGLAMGNVRGVRFNTLNVRARVVDAPPHGLAVEGSCSCHTASPCDHMAALLINLASSGKLVRSASLATPSGQHKERANSGTATEARGGGRSKAGILGRSDGPVERWLTRLVELMTAGVAKARYMPSNWPPAWTPAELKPGYEVLLYSLNASAQAGRSVPVFTAESVRVLKSGAFGRAVPFRMAHLGYRLSATVSNEDRAIAECASELSNGRFRSSAQSREVIAKLLGGLVRTGRCYWLSHQDSESLRPGPVRRSELSWQLAEGAALRIAIAPPAAGVEVFSSDPPWYVDRTDGTSGPLDLGLSLDLVQAALASPAVPLKQLAEVRERFSALLGDTGLPLPPVLTGERRIKAKPVPCLALRTQTLADGRVSDVAELKFDYDGYEVAPVDDETEKRLIREPQVVIVERKLALERAARGRLAEAGLAVLPQSGGALTLQFADARSEPWLTLVYRVVPGLIDEGWRVGIEEGFRHRVVEGAGDWALEVENSGPNGWFDIDLGIEVDGERLPLLPILVAMLARLPDPTAPGAIDALASSGFLYHKLPDGRSLALPLERARKILNTLAEINEARAVSADGRLRISLGQAAALAQLEQSCQLRWFGGEQVRTLVTRLAGFTGIMPVAAPDGFQAELRPYQSYGLSWLQFLRAYGLSGILADDMGLGKTVQTLAHLLVEKQAGRLDRPCLVVCPTSLVPTWTDEAERFAPDLSVLVLHGARRAGAFDTITKSDLVITTYALLPRDGEVLLAQPWYVVVLDEAQAIKNPTAKATNLVSRLETRYRLCLTGTPIENHLGELWSLFTFLMPGLLGDHKQFNRLFRTPVEKHGDRDRQAGLSARVRPFMLRRTKDEVAADLPARTEIVCPVALSGAQRDFYETLRLAMHQKVQQAVASRGLAQSQIIVLDALLKLRQVCCDPRLVKLEAARTVQSSAKLEFLMEMLPEMVEEGRRILLFSQFTEMLDLIAAAVTEAGIPFVELRGDTRDRRTPVKQFQAGEVPLFLISLKAGGTGLTLTAADTVIHYDPWWNPAVERQATDRAHRLGQDKPVFVYKLITEGTIEERMVDPQRRKQGLMEGLFEATDKAGKAIDATDIEALFTPLG